MIKTILQSSVLNLNGQKAKTIMLTVLCLLASITTQAYVFEVDGINYNVLTDSTVAVTSNPSASYGEEVTIPSSVTYKETKFDVVSIANYAFFEKQGSQLKTIKIPSSVKKIGVGAFYSCRSLTTVNIDEGLEEISGDAFCFTSVENVKLPESLRKIGSNAFMSCGNLAEITIPDGVTEIGDFAFRSSGITKVKLSQGMTAIADYTFYNCSKLTSVEIGSNTTDIGDCAFSGCESLISIEIPASVKNIGATVFSGCSSLSSVSFSEGLQFIGYDAFRGCDGLTSIKLPESLNTIGAGAFAECDGLVSVVIPDAVSVIYQQAFEKCKNLTSVTLPKSLKSIPQSMFKGCNGLTSIEIPESVTSIGDDAFYQCSGLTSVTIPSSVKEIGSYSFYGCNALSSVNLPEGLTSIGYNAFGYCKSLAAINIPSSVTSIDAYAFDETQISRVDIASVESWMNIILGGNLGIDTFDFYVDGVKLTDLEIPSSITIVGSNFSEYKGLESITFHKDVTTIAKEAFKDCSSVKKIVCQSEVSPTCGVNALEGISRSECSLYVPKNSLSTYQSTTPWSEFLNIIESEETAINTVPTYENNVSVRGENIIVSNAANRSIEVYDVSGAIIQSLIANGEQTVINGLTSGKIYIIKVGQVSYKIKL